MNITQILLLWVAAWSIIAFFAMGSDKKKAKQNKRRTPEKTLFLFAVLGGAPGALAGMYAFHHKTKHWYFVVGFWALSLLWVLILIKGGEVLH